MLECFAAMEFAINRRESGSGLRLITPTWESLFLVGVSARKTPTPPGCQIPGGVFVLARGPEPLR